MLPCSPLARYRYEQGPALADESLPLPLATRSLNLSALKIMSDTPHALSKDDTLDEGELTKPHWFRSTTTQAVILGLASFCCPGARHSCPQLLVHLLDRVADVLSTLRRAHTGIWGAMANLGAGGLQSAATGNAATVRLFLDPGFDRAPRRDVSH